MGTFLGHLLPGAFFVGFSFWWISQITKTKMVCRQKNILFNNTATYPCLQCSCSRRWSGEGITKIITTALGAVLELFASMDYGRESKIVFPGNIQHVTMYLLFLTSGIADVMCQRRLVPRGTDYLVMALAFVGEGVLFHFHLHGRSSLDVQIHTILVYVILACATSFIVELNYPNNSLVAYTRAYIVLLQGTWFVQVGFILYPPFPFLNHWDGEDADALLFAVLFFAWHIMVNVMVVVGVTMLTHRLYWNCCPPMRGDLDYELMGIDQPEVMERHTVEGHHRWNELSNTPDASDSEGSSDSLVAEPVLNDIRTIVH